MLHTAFVPFEDIFIEHIENHRKNNMSAQHYHETYEIYLQLGGERYLFHDDICYTLKRGDLVVFKPFDIHYTASQESDYYERYIINFHSDKLSMLLDHSEMNKLFDTIKSSVIHLNEAQLEVISSQLKTVDLYTKRSGFLAEKLLYSAVLQLVVSVSDLSDLEETVSHHNIQSEIITAIDYIGKHYHENIDLDTLSEFVHMSKYHFCRLFHKATGATFLQYLYNIRLKNVHQLLIKSDLPLNKIAAKTGFSSTPHLSRIFREVYQISPREFRKNAK